MKRKVWIISQTLFCYMLLTLFFTLSPMAATVEELEKRVMDLENVQKPAEKKSDLKPKLFGYIETWYQKDDSDLAAGKVDNEFRVRRARIDVKGNVTDAVGYRVTANLDGAASTRAQLWDGYITYKLHPLALVTVGQFKYNFTLEGLEGTPDRIPVLRAESINDIATPLGTKGGSLRDVGVQLSGGRKDVLGLKYGVALINGAGLNTRDNNNDKDVVGRVTISPLNGFTLGVSGYQGKGETEDAAIDVDETAYGAHAELILKDMGLSFRGEYVKAKWKNWGYTTTTTYAPSCSSTACTPKATTTTGWKALNGTDQEPNGLYLQAAYKLPPLPDLQVMARYEDYEKDSNTPNSHLKTTTLGATYYIKDKTRITANYLMRDAEDSPIVTAQETSATGDKIGNLILVQMLVAY
ncbi:MAG TPA: porin [Thermodesulfobacteriota bacterium]|nr:porin [Thermodesulfobacteriota bacterium]